MNFSNFNSWFYTLPEAFHLLAFALVVGLYAHLFLGFWTIRKRIKPHVIWYFCIRYGFMFTYVFGKVQDDKYGMFDVFLPLYLISYIDGLIILKGHNFHRCKSLRDAIRQITNFESRKK